jgi:DNA polymerase-3 subunit gamma/tau
MSSLVLYRKYRPQSFSQVVGQEHVTRTLKNALASGFWGHAYLFAGPRGCGKTSLARILAKAVNCWQRKPGQFEPCNQCDSCLEINQGRAIDLIEIDAGTNTGIDNIRELKDSIRFLPVKSNYKVFIIDECHQLSGAAANALLKTLEEPPQHALFILATTESSKLIPTILSRVQRFDFHKFSLAEIKTRLAGILRQEGIGFQEEALDLIAFQSGGALRDAETLLEEVVSFVGQDNKIEKQEVQAILGIPDSQAVLRFLTYLQKKQAKEAVQFLNEIIFQAVDIKEFAKSLTQFLRELLLLKLDLTESSFLWLALNESARAQLQQLAVGFSEKEIRLILESFSAAENKLKYASIPQLPLELAIVEICSQTS